VTLIGHFFDTLTMAIFHLGYGSVGNGGIHLVMNYSVLNEVK
jgi:hypothetical protein